MASIAELKSYVSGKIPQLHLRPTGSSGPPAGDRSAVPLKDVSIRSLRIDNHAARQAQIAAWRRQRAIGREA
jgi:hypothetical protein